MKLKKIFFMVFVVGILCFITQMDVSAERLKNVISDSIEIPEYSTYKYPFEIVESGDVKFGIIDGNTYADISSYIVSSDFTETPLLNGNQTETTVYLTAGKYTLYIANEYGYEKNYLFEISSYITQEAEENTNNTIEDSEKEEVVPDTLEFDLPNYKVTEKVINGEKIKSITTYAGDIIVTDLLFKGSSNFNFDFNSAKVKLSDKSIVKKDPDLDGWFIAEKPGDCIITVTCEGITTKLNIHVDNTTYSFKKSKFTMSYGKTVAPTIIRKNGEKMDLFKVVKVTSSNKKVAVYDTNNEVIKAVGSGSCTLTFTLPYNRNIKCTVTVPRLTLTENINSQVAYSSDLSLIYKETINKIKYPYANVFIGNRLKDTKTITFVEFSVYQYDNKGTRVNVSNSNFTWNDNIYGGSTIHVYTSANVKKYHSCVKKVYYDNGTTWTNPYYEEWATKYKSKY